MQSEDMHMEWWLSAVFYTHLVMHLVPLNIMFHSMIIHETELWSYDEFRKYLPKAENASVIGMSDFWYSYYLLDSIEGKLLRIFTHESLDISSFKPNYKQLLIFQNMKEKEAFDGYLADHFNDYTDNDINTQYRFQIQEDNSQNGGGLIYSVFQVAKCDKLYED